MKFKRVYYIILVLSSLNSFSQNKVSLDVFSGLGFNKEISLLEEKINNYSSVTTQINTNYNFSIYKKIKAETGLGLQWYYSTGNIGLSKFTAQTLRFNIPFLLGYSILEKLNIATGVTIGNNRDFDDFNLRQENNFRTSLVIKSEYLVKENFSFLFKINRNLSNIPNSYLLNQPSLDILLGFSCKLF